MQRLRLAARLVNASPLLMASCSLMWVGLGRRSCSATLNCYARRKKPELEVEGVSDFEKLWCEFPKAWKLLVSSRQQLLVERRQRSEPAQAALVPVLPTFGCDECDAVYFKLQALRSQ